MIKAKFDDKSWGSVSNEKSGSLEDENIGYHAFDVIWAKCKDRATQYNDQKERLDSQLRLYHDTVVHLAAQFSEFKNVVRGMPIIVVIGDWIRELAITQYDDGKYLFRMLDLLEKNVIPLQCDNELATLEYFISRGHQEVLERIRCVEGWSILEKERAVQAYIQFSRNLARQTYGLIPPGFDPDRDRVQRKAVKYDHFIDFVQHLPRRDALIAKLLYFGAPSMEEVLSLKRGAIGSDNFLISFDIDSISFPGHVILDLRAYIAEADEKQALVFANLRGAEVERAHLNQSFARACEKIETKVKITPGSLLRLENETTKAWF